MTEEELKQELIDVWHKTFNVFILTDEQAEKICKVMLEPREKRIEELEQKLEQTEKDLADYQFNYPSIKELEKENARLKEELSKKADTNHLLVEQMANLESENAELKAQIKVLEQNLEDTEICENGWKNRVKDLEAKIEKMKCCYNCKYQVRDECGDFCGYKGISGVSGDCDKWESEE